jgi:hypothetical protein
MVEAAGIEDARANATISLRDATLPRIGPSSLENLDPAAFLLMPTCTGSDRGFMAT